MRINYRFMLSFLLIAMICISTLAISTYLLYGNYSRRQIEQQRLTAFCGAQSLIDQRLEHMINYGQSLSAQSARFLSGADNVVDRQQLLSLLINFESSMGGDLELSYLLRAAPSVIWTSGGEMSYTSYERLLSGRRVNSDLSHLFSLLLSASEPRLCPAPDSDRFFVVLPIGGAWTGYSSTLAILLAQDMLLDVLRDPFAGETVSLFVIDPYGREIASASDERLRSLPDQTLYATLPAGVSYRSVDGVKMVFLRQPSSTGMGSYVLAAPQTVFFASWYAVSAQLRLLFALVAVFALALSVALGVISYRPIRSAYARIVGERPEQPVSNELNQIVDSYEAMKRGVDSLENSLSVSLGLLRRQFLLLLINNRMQGEEEFLLYKRCLGMALDRPYYLALYLPLPAGAAERTDQALLALESFYIEDGETLFAECRWEQGIAILLNFAAENGEARAAALARSALGQLSSQLPGVVTLGMGSLERTHTRLGVSFYRATTAVRVAPPALQSSVLFYAEPGEASSARLDTTLLSESVTFGNAAVALATLDEMLRSLSHSSEPLPVLRLKCNDILSCMLRVAERQRLSADKALVLAAADFGSLEEFTQYARRLIEQLCAASASRRSEEASLERSSVLSFITQNYRRSDLSLKLLSEETGVSMSKINMMLKETLGCSFVPYVSLLRLEEVKRLLRETQLSINAIIQSVGYLDVSSFMRKFKKMEGVSPGQYRQTHRQKNMVKK